MKLHNLYITIILTLFVSSLFAQTSMRVVSGVVVDQSGQPVANAVVSINEGAQSLKTDADGSFSMELLRRTYFLIEAEGFDSKMITERDLIKSNNIVALESAATYGINDKVYTPYRNEKQEHKNLTSAITSIDVDESYARDSRSGVYSLLNSKVLGLMPDNTLRNYGKMVYVVDGLVTENIDHLKSQEIENISVMKDGVARMLYGAQADAGVVLITTKRGENYTRSASFNFETGVNRSLGTPEFVDGATNMELYNKALTNSGGNLANLYTQDVIDNTRNGVDKVLYPDEDYFSEEFIKPMTNFTSLYGETSGGNQNATYFMNLVWDHSNGWLAMGDDATDYLAVKGKVASSLTSWLKFNSDVAISFDINKSNSLGYGFYNAAATTLSYKNPLLIPIDRIADQTSYLPSSVIDGKYVLGGSTAYQQNLYGEGTIKTGTNNMRRLFTANLGFQMDFNKWVKGLTGNVYGGFEYMNNYAKFYNNQYAVYDVIGGEGDALQVERMNSDVSTTQRTVNNGALDFYRKTAAYANFNYDRTFGAHNISAVVMGSWSEQVFNSVIQTKQNFNVGFSGAYTYDDRYIAEFGVTAVTSAKLDPKSRVGVAPSFGLGWIASNEEFMPDEISFLKLRANYSDLINDSWTLGNSGGYLLYEPLYSTGYLYSYNYDGSHKNASYQIYSLAANTSFQHRREYNLGFELGMFDNKTRLEANYFDSEVYDIFTNMSALAPSTMGYLPLYENYNAYRNKGIEVALGQTINAGDVTIDINGRYLYTSTRHTKVAELNYGLESLSSVGRQTHALMGIASDGYYTEDDFDSYGNMNNPKYEAPFGDVKVGDIRYLASEEFTVSGYGNTTEFGSWLNNHVASLDINVTYNNWNFYMLCTGAFGGTGVKNNGYYHFYGNEPKFSVEALKAFDPEHPNPNAEYPRLTLGGSPNNYQTSKTWFVDLSNVNISAMQLSYTWKPSSLFFSSIRGYVRASNILTIAKEKEYLQLRYGNSPLSSSVVVGANISF